MNDKPTIKTAEQTYDPDATRTIVAILKEISPEYADYSYNLIDCLERIADNILLYVKVVSAEITPKESTDAMMWTLAKSIEKIHEAMVRDDDNAIEKL